MINYKRSKGKGQVNEKKSTKRNLKNFKKVLTTE